MSNGYANKIKVLFLINDLGLGGVEKLTVNFANSMDREKFEVFVVTLFSRQTSFFGKKDFKEDVNLINLSFRNFWDILQWRRLYGLIKKNKIDLIFTQLFMADTVGRITAFLVGVPVIVTAIQNIIPDLPFKFIATNRILRLITDACICPTAAITEYAKKVIKFPPEKITEIPTNSVDGSRFTDLKIDKVAFKRSLDIPESAKIVITIGRLINQKGHSILLEAAPKVLEKYENIYFVIVGGGHLEQTLKEKAKKLELANRVIFLGPRGDTPELLAVSDIFAFPSIWEGQGLILFEAFFSKIPIVASDTGGIPDVVKDGETGTLVRPGSAEDLAEKLLSILENPEKGRLLADQAFLKYKDRTIANSTKKLEDLFLKLLRADSNLTKY